MSKKKKKENNKTFPTDYVLDCIQEYTTEDAIHAVSTYLTEMDGSHLSLETKYEINNLFSTHPSLIKLICCACEEQGYNSF